jgi:predicted Kef-type K+ transport protein
MNPMKARLLANKTLCELVAGSVLFCMIWELVLLIFTQRRLYHSIGLAVGTVICIALAINMADSIDVAVELDEKQAVGYLRKKAAIRYLIVCAAIIILALTGIGNPLTCFAGVMGLKAGAYMQPLTHRLITRFSSVFKNEIKE